MAFGEHPYVYTFPVEPGCWEETEHRKVIYNCIKTERDFEEEIIF